jgi:malate dehydrogenase
VAKAGGVPGQRKTTEAKFKVCVVGAAGGIGQPLSLAAASHPLVKELSIIDLNIAAVPVDGVAADLSHVEGPTKIIATSLTLGEDKAIDKAGEALSGCNAVLVPAGLPRKPGQDRKDLMNVNADIAKGTLEACAKYCPDAVIGLIVNPVNSIVPAMAELYKKAGLNPENVVGITTLDCVRANKFVQEITGELPDVTVIGGHAGKTILPLFSQDATSSGIPAGDIPALDERTQNAGTEVVKAKAGKGSATLSMAFAAARWLDAVLEGLNGNPTTECAYVQSSAVPELPYFSSKVVFGPKGVQEVLPIGEINEHEKARLAELIPILKEEIDDGLEYAKTHEFEK